MPQGLTFGETGLASNAFLRVNQPGAVNEIWRTTGPIQAIHGVGSPLLAFYRDGQMYLHNLNNGFAVFFPGGGLSKSLLAVDYPFTYMRGDVRCAYNPDIVFYGAGADEEAVFFVYGDQFVEYKSGTLVEVGDLETRFPSLGRFFRRKPQIYLVEYYSLETYLGDLIKGRLVETIFTPPRETTSSVEVVTIVRSATNSLRQNLVQSYDTATIKDFRQRMDKKEDTSSDKDSYSYWLYAAFHGDVEANSLWGGEVNARLGVQGGSDDVRNKFAKSTFNTVATQVTDSTHEVDYKCVDQQTADGITSSVYSKRQVTFDNRDGNSTLTTQIYEALEPYCSVLTLKNIEICYFDGVDQQIVSLDRFSENAANWFTDQAEAKRIQEYIATELQNILNADGETVSILDPNDPESLRVNRAVPSTYLIDGTQQISTRGIIKAVVETKQRTYGVIPVDTP
jgi:hypothetical protein